MGAAEALGGFAEDGFGDTVGIFVHFAVPEADHGPALCFEGAGADSIIGRINMLAAIDFDDQPRLPAGEIGGVRLIVSCRVNLGR